MPWIAPVVVIAQASGGDRKSVAGYALLMLILLLLIIALVFGWFLMRSLQRSRKRLGRKPMKPTDATDVWSMHKPPEFDSDSDSGE